MTTIDTSTEAVERLLEGVTPGPWRDAKSYRGIVSDSPSGYDDAESVYAYGGHMVCESVMDHNRPFIAAARELIPALLKERDEARAQLADAEANALRMALAEVMRSAASYVVASHKEDPLTIGAALAALADKIEKGEMG